MSAISLPQLGHARGVTTDQIVADLGKTAISVVAGTAAGFALNMLPFVGGVPLVGGVVFCVASVFSFPYIENALLNCLDMRQTTGQKVAIKAATIFASMCLGALALSLIGFSVSILSVVAVTAAVQLTAYLLQNRSMGYPMRGSV